MYKDKEYIIHKDVIKNTEWDPHHKWKKNRMNIGLKIKTSSDYHMVELKNAT